MPLSQLGNFTQFPFTVTYRPGKQNGRADALSHQETSAGDAEAELLPCLFSLCKFFFCVSASQYFGSVHRVMASDPLAMQFWQGILHRKSRERMVVCIAMSGCISLLTRCAHKVLQRCYDALTVGHGGHQKTASIHTELLVAYGAS